MTRRESLRALISGGAAYRERQERKGARTRHQDTRIYHGPITLPDEILETLGRSPVFRTTSKHLALRVQRDGITYLLRTALSGSDYVGEVVRTESGVYRVHCWTVSIVGGRPLAAILERDQEQQPPAKPPVSVPIQFDAVEPEESDYLHYFDAPLDLTPRRVTLEALQD